MRNLSIISFGLSTLWALGSFQEASRAQAAGINGIPAGNGDVNADGYYDQSDAIYLLQWVFLGGPEPVSIACTACPGKAIPRTGQSSCFDALGSLFDCSSSDYPGQDGHHQPGCPMEGRFEENGDGTVTDNCTGLQWQMLTAQNIYDWQGALKYCDRLTLAGQNNWRLPNVRELQSIIDFGRYNPAVDPVFQTSSGGYWSSSSVSGSPGKAWYITGRDGLVIGHDGVKSLPFYVRAVRG